MDAYKELINRRNACNREAERCLKDIQTDWELLRSNYGDMIFNEVEEHLLHPDTLGNRILRFFVGKKQSPSKKILTPTGRPSQGFLKQISDFARPLFLSAILGYAKRSITRRFRKRK